ncbi:hypothetical protein OPV22_010531 [Ensete ventricosum]|uniref:Cyclin N-terminal domain-containing protein n=1 Tax=Ensete ventricosum TaxID=4639 RepID=A0AAV8RJB4_ENSVE|nr:hypothetical protein OPV22_010531 [Ensete ventricosum]
MAAGCLQEKASLLQTPQQRKTGSTAKLLRILKAAAEKKSEKTRRSFLKLGNQLVDGLDHLPRSIPLQMFPCKILLKTQLSKLRKNLVVLADDIVTNKGYEKVVQQKDPVAIKSSTDSSTDEQISHTTSGISGLSNDTEDLYHVIDALDGDSELAVVEYVDDIYNFYKLGEKCGRPRKYMDFQIEIKEEMRCTLADRLIEEFHCYELVPETLYLTFYIVDQYLSREKVMETDLMLVGVGAMLIASKYEDPRPIGIEDCIDITHGAFSKEQILAKEKAIIEALEWNITVPTQYVFLTYFLKAAMSDKEMEDMVFFFSELGLMPYSFITFWPSLVAASAVYAARCTLKKTPRWTEMLVEYTGYSEQQLLECARVLVSLHSSAAESKLKAVYETYSEAEFGAVALYPPSMELL